MTDFLQAAGVLGPFVFTREDGQIRDAQGCPLALIEDLGEALETPLGRLLAASWAMRKTLDDIKSLAADGRHVQGAPLERIDAAARAALKAAEGGAR